MKIPTLFLASTLIFLFISPSLSSRIATVNDLVYDSEGNPLEMGTAYHIAPSPYSVPGGGEITLVDSSNVTCQQDVIQFPPFILPLGVPFLFTPTSFPTGETTIKVRSPLAIHSSYGNPCGESTIWKVSSRMDQIITTGGSFNTPDSCLQIVKEDPANTNTYSFEHCVHSCGGPKLLCNPIGIYQEKDGGHRHLAIQGNEELKIIFIRALPLESKAIN